MSKQRYVTYLSVRVGDQERDVKTLDGPPAENNKVLCSHREEARELQKKKERDVVSLVLHRAESCAGWRSGLSDVPGRITERDAG
jgi:hypothetical protein